MVKDYHLESGMKVKEGDILVQLDTGDIDIEIQQAKNTLESSKAKIGRRIGHEVRPGDRPSPTSPTPRALFKMGQISDSDYQKGRRAVDHDRAAAADGERAEQGEPGPRPDDTRGEGARQGEDDDHARRSTARFPSCLAHPGDLIDPGSPIVALITTAREVQAKISEEDFADIREGQPVSAIFLPYHEWVYNGTVKKILPTADPETLSAPGRPQHHGYPAGEADPRDHGRGLDRGGPARGKGDHTPAGAPQRERLRRQGRPGGAKAGQEGLSSG